MQPKPENNVQLDKIRKTQTELQEVTRMMEENIMATQQRGEMMDHLQVKTGTWHGSGRCCTPLPFCEGYVQDGFQNSSTTCARERLLVSCIECCGHLML